MDTIVAVSSGRPPAAIAVIRISGENAMATATRLAGKLPSPRQAGLRRLRDNAGEPLDDALVLVFPGPASATGEDVVELHCHGGRAVTSAVERALLSEPGVRRAEPGEFTRRALIAGRIDLAQAQGLADLLSAETEAQRRAAIGAVEGRLSRAVQGWMDQVARLSAEAEAALDFAEEDDVPDDPAVVQRIAAGMRDIAAEVGAVLASPAVDRLHDGIRVVLAGPPNSGKSTLFNLLVQRDAAIVSPIAGTTRDRIEAGVQRDGLPFLLIDTAGLTDRSDDVIELVGVERAQQAIVGADVVLWLGDTPPARADAIWVHPRADLPGRAMLPIGRSVLVRSDQLATVDEVWVRVIRMAHRLVPAPDALALHEAQREYCASAQAALDEPWTDLLIGAELLRRTRRSLASLLGQNATEVMLDSLFGQFCLGK